MRAKITVRWAEDLVQNKDTGNFYWRVRPFITQRNYIEKGDYEKVIEQYRRHFGASGLSKGALRNKTV